MRRENMRFENTLYEFRRVRNMTQSDLARRADVSRQTIASIEKGDSEPRLSLAVSIAQVLRGDVYDVFFHDGKMKAEKYVSKDRIADLYKVASVMETVSVTGLEMRLICYQMGYYI